MHTGMRRGEVLGLRWQDIDLKNRKIHVVQNVTHKGNRPVIGTPKTRNSKRSLPLTDELIKLLQPMNDIGYVIGGAEPVSVKSYNTRLNRIRKQVNLYGATAHVLRHTYLTHLAGAGVDLKTLQYIAGHAHIQTTMNIYVHAQEENITKAGNILTDMIHNYSVTG